MAKAVEGSSSPNIGKRMIPLKLLIGLVFVGWLMMWVVVPTNTYRKTWQPKLLSETNSTYFGRQGTTMLIFTFPILFIAAVGCIYLHLEQKSGSADSSSLRRRLEAWSKPVLVKGPLGIVSAIELAFCMMFLALIIWSFFSSLNVGLSSLKDEGVESWQAKLATAGLRLGLVGNLCCAFLFFPVMRGSSLLPLVGLTSESSIRYHIWLGHIVMVLFTAHGVCFVILWAATSSWSQMLKWDNVGESNLAGEIALLSGLFMWATTFPRIRRKMFELFFYAHQLYILFLIFFLCHVGISFSCYILPGVYLFMVDRYLRFLQSRSKVRLVSARLLPSETVELNFSKSAGFNYNPLSIIFVHVPSVSSLQWHPFTVSSNSNLEPDRLSVIIKKEGSWTHKLYQTLSSSTPLDHLDVSVEGPYGPISMNFLRYDSLVMVSGGSGITPFISIIRELIHRSTALDGPIPSVHLICAFKTSADLTMLDLLLPISCNASDLSRLQLRIEAFVTREKPPASDAQKHIQTVCFKPFSSDLPIAPVLGPNGWLWLGAIVSSSFVAFLVLIGILTHYYIYPIDHNTNSIFSYAARSVLNLLFICACIAITASAAVFWNKRRITMEAKKKQNTNVPMPGKSRSSYFSNENRELESVPQESIVKATTLHYGERPNVKKMLSTLDGSNIGVMASGPSVLRHDVAAVCSSGHANTLHFESISFSW